MKNAAMIKPEPDNLFTEEQPPEPTESAPIEQAAAEALPAETVAEVAGPVNEPPAEAIEGGRDFTQAKLILEAALLSSNEPLQLIDLKKLFDQELSADTVRRLLDELKADWSDRAVELTPVASGWRFRVKPEFARFVQRMNPEKPPRYSRAVLETLAIIAYRQPATRGDIEQIRGVTVSTQIVKTLEERGWIEAIGHREVPGRPALYATTRRFLDDLNLRSLEELPPLDELQATLDVTTVDVVPASAESAPAPTDAAAAPEADGTPIIEVEPVPLESIEGESAVATGEAVHDEEAHPVPRAAE